MSFYRAFTPHWPGNDQFVGGGMVSAPPPLFNGLLTGLSTVFVDEG